MPLDTLAEMHYGVELMIKYGAYTKKGIKKKVNEDRILIDDNLMEKDLCSGSRENELVSIVCDGVGSTMFGAQAAEIIAESFREFKAYEASPNILIKHLDMVNQIIVEEEKRKDNGYSMASTVAGIILCKDNYVAFNLGDTHIYKFVEGNLSLISYDHTVGNESNFFFCSTNENKEALTRYMGGDGMACYPFFKRGKVEDNTVFFICSDGVYKHVSEQDIKSILNSDSSIYEKINRLFKLAIDGGSTDDISIVLIDYSQKNALNDSVN